MPEIIDQIVGFVEKKPWIAVGAAVGGAAIVAFALRRPDEGEPVDESAVPVEQVSPLSGLAPGYPGVIVNQPSMQAPGPQQVPAQSFVSILRDGRTLDVTAGPPGLCPPGYVSAQQPGQAPRCTLVNPARKEKGQRQVFFPSRGESAFL